MSEWSEIADGVRVHRTARVEVGDLRAGRGTVVNAHAELYGTSIRLGRECWIDEYAVIGGGSAFDPVASLVAGDWLHLGMFSQVNIARPVTIGDEVGIGISTRVFSHGAYLSEWEGFPVAFEGVTIGSRVWLPKAQVNPGIRIGDDVVAAAGSMITEDVPAGSFVGGVPARVITKDAYPRRLSGDERVAVLDRIATEVTDICGQRCRVDGEAGTLAVAGTTFVLDGRTIDGPATTSSEKARNQLRRHGIRFRYDVEGDRYVPWSAG